MFTPDIAIDSIQSTKKQLVKAFVSNPTMADALNQFVDTQTEYTKTIVKAGTDAWTTMTQETSRIVTESTKFDYVKFGEGIMKAYQANLNAFGNTAKRT
jgi:23S rRNA maturation mini-RNase III